MSLGDMAGKGHVCVRHKINNKTGSSGCLSLDWPSLHPASKNGSYHSGSKMATSPFSSGQNHQQVHVPPGPSHFFSSPPFGHHPPPQTMHEPCLFCCSGSLIQNHPHPIFLNLTSFLCTWAHFMCQNPIKVSFKSYILPKSSSPSTKACIFFSLSF